MAGLPSAGFLPVMDVEFDGQLRVLRTNLDDLTLLPENADKLFNRNGEGYYDPPTLRSLTWHVALKQAGAYQVEISYKRGRFSRVVDVKVGSKLVKATLYGNEADSAKTAAVELEASDDLTVSVEPGSPAMRGAKLDFEITKVALVRLK